MNSTMTSTVLGIVGAGLTLAACGSGSGPSAKGNIKTDASIVYAIASDPGNLDPQLTSVDLNREVGRFAYDPLVYRNKDGKIVSGLAQSWKVGESTSTFDLKDGIACSDGTKFTAETAANNLSFILKDGSGSPYASSFPKGTTASASGSTLTLSTPQPASFLLVNLADIPMVCQAGLDDRKGLASKTLGTGLYTLTGSKTGTSYTYTRNDKYTWGPDGASASLKGVPKKVTLRVISNKTTAANLIASGDVNIAVVSGPDQKRLEKMKNLHIATNKILRGLFAFNEAPGRITQDIKIREALVKGVDLKAARSVITGGSGSKPTTLLSLEPKVCPGNTVDGNIPGTDVAKAKKVLDDAGWVAGNGGQRSKDGKALKVNILTPNFAGPGYTDGADYVASQWRKLGIKVSINAVPAAQLNDALFSTANYDVSLVGIAERTPNQMSQYFSGPRPPTGTNFPALTNKAYDAVVNGTPKVDPKQECDRWNNAETALFKDFSVVPFANVDVPVFGNKVTFDEIGGWIVPSSIRAYSK